MENSYNYFDKNVNNSFPEDTNCEQSDVNEISKYDFVMKQFDDLIAELSTSRNSDKNYSIEPCKDLLNSLFFEEQRPHEENKELQNVVANSLSSKDFVEGDKQIQSDSLSLPRDSLHTKLPKNIQISNKATESPKINWIHSTLWDLQTRPLVSNVNENKKLYVCQNSSASDKSSFSDNKLGRTFVKDLYKPYDPLSEPNIRHLYLIEGDKKRNFFYGNKSFPSEHSSHPLCASPMSYGRKTGNQHFKFEVKPLETFSTLNPEKSSSRHASSSSYMQVDLFIEAKNYHFGPLPFEIYPKMSLRLLKLKVEKEYGISSSAQRWILGKIFAVDDEKSLIDFNLKQGSPVFLYVDSSVTLKHLSPSQNISNGDVDSNDSVSYVQSNIPKKNMNCTQDAASSSMCVEKWKYVLNQVPSLLMECTRSAREVYKNNKEVIFDYNSNELNDMQNLPSREIKTFLDETSLGNKQVMKSTNTCSEVVSCSSFNKSNPLTPYASSELCFSSPKVRNRKLNDEMNFLESKINPASGVSFNEKIENIPHSITVNPKMRKKDVLPDSTTKNDDHNLILKKKIHSTTNKISLLNALSPKLRKKDSNGSLAAVADGNINKFWKIDSNVEFDQKISPTSKRKNLLPNFSTQSNLKKKLEKSNENSISVRKNTYNKNNEPPINILHLSSERNRVDASVLNPEKSNKIVNEGEFLVFTDLLHSENVGNDDYPSLNYDMQSARHAEDYFTCDESEATTNVFLTVSDASVRCNKKGAFNCGDAHLDYEDSKIGIKSISNGSSCGKDDNNATNVREDLKPKNVSDESSFCVSESLLKYPIEDVSSFNNACKEVNNTEAKITVETSEYKSMEDHFCNVYNINNFPSNDTSNIAAHGSNTSDNSCTEYIITLSTSNSAYNHGDDTALIDNLTKSTNFDDNHRNSLENNVFDGNVSNTNNNDTAVQDKGEKFRNAMNQHIAVSANFTTNGDSHAFKKDSGALENTFSFTSESNNTRTSEIETVLENSVTSSTCSNAGSNNDTSTFVNSNNAKQSKVSILRRLSLKQKDRSKDKENPVLENHSATFNNVHIEIQENCNLDFSSENDSKDESKDSKIDTEAVKRFELLLEIENMDIVENAVNFICPVCFDDFESGQGIVLHDCLHTFCRSCLSKTINYAEEALIKCPFRDDLYSCESHLQQREIKALVSEEEYEKYLQRSVMTAEGLAERSFHCKTPDCSGWCVYEDTINIFHCPACNHFNCLNCQAIHEGLNCRQYQEKLKVKQKMDLEAEKTVDFLNKMIENGKALKCPRCDLILMKKWGCDWLKCSICQTEICWITKGPRWGPGGQGDTSGGCRCGVNGVKCHPSCTYCH